MRLTCSPRVYSWPVLRTRSSQVWEDQKCSNWVKNGTFGSLSGGGRVQGVARDFGGWSLLVLTGLGVGHCVARTAVPFGSAPGLPGGQWFGSGARWLCGEQHCPGAGGKPPGAAHSRWANVAVAKALGTSLMSQGESWPHENGWECCHGCSTAKISASLPVMCL